MDVNPLTPEHATGWFQLAERYGLPIVMLFVLMCFVSLVAWAFWRAIKPHFDRFMERHVLLMDTLAVCLQKLTTAGDNVAGRLDDLEELIKEGDELCRTATAEARKESREDVRSFYENSRAERLELRNEHNSALAELRAALGRVAEHLQMRTNHDARRRASEANLDNPQTGSA